MKKKISEYTEIITHFIMCFIGGYLGSYSLLLRGNFGSAQTSNLIQIFINLEKGNIFDATLRIFAFIIYIGTLSIGFLVVKKYEEKSKKICILIEIIGIFSIGLIPKDTNNLVALLPIFFITAFQWGSFNGTKEYSSPTLFSTGNIKKFIYSWTEYILTKDIIIQGKAIFYTGTLLFYHCGVIAGIYLVNLFQVQSIWFTLIPLFITFILIVFFEKNNKICKKCFTNENLETMN